MQKTRSNTAPFSEIDQEFRAYGQLPYSCFSIEIGRLPWGCRREDIERNMDSMMRDSRNHGVVIQNPELPATPNLHR